MKLNEAEMRMAYKIESTNQASVLNEISVSKRPVITRSCQTTIWLTESLTVLGSL